MSGYFAVDNLLYEKGRGGDKLLGRIEEWPESPMMVQHATSLRVPVGEFARLTGTIFVFHSGGGFLFYHLTMTEA